jgi:hypothetical protein
MIARIALLCALLLPSLCFAVDIATPSGKVSFQLPEGYTQLSRAELQKQFGRSGSLPLAAYGNAGRTSTIAITWALLDSGGLAPEQLPTFKSQLQDNFDQQIPGIQWLKSEMRRLNGKSWIYLEYISPARDTRIHNATFTADLGGNLLLVNFNSADSTFAATAPVFATVQNSLVAK